MILFGPTIWTVIPCGYHQLGPTWPDITHDTGSIMIVDISFERIEGAHFILGAVYAPSFKTVSVFSIFGLVWQTEVVASSSCVVVMTTCYEPWVAHQNKMKGVSINLACVAGGISYASVRASAFVLVARPWTRVTKPWEDWWRVACQSS